MTTEDLVSEEAEDTDDFVDRLRKSEEIYARAFLGNPVAMSITNGMTGRFTEINSAFAALVGYSRSELIGRTSEELGLWPRRARREEIATGLLQGDELPLVAGRVRVKAGNEVAVLVGFRLLDIDRAPAVLSVLVPTGGS
jgi:PAS domain S-box-containing protein